MTLTLYLPRIALLLLLQVAAAAQDESPASPEDADSLRATVTEIVLRAEAAIEARDGRTAKAEGVRALELLEPLPPEEDVRETADLFQRLGYVLARVRNHEPAARAYERATRAYTQVLPEDHRQLLAARSSLAYSLGALGRPEEALAIQRSILEILERTHGAEDRQVLRQRQEVANFLSAVGDKPGCLAIFEDLVSIYERIAPEDDKDRLDALQNLMVSRAQTGDLEGALVVGEECFDVLARTRAPDDRSLILCRKNLSHLYKRLGYAEKKLALLEVWVAELEGAVSADHPDLQEAMNDLASTLNEVGQPVRARAYFERVLAVYERTLPEDDWRIFSTRGNLAVTMDAMGDHAGALALHRSVLAAKERLLPPDHKDLAHLRANLAVTLSKLGRKEEALEMQSSVVLHYERTLPADSAALLHARLMLASCLKGVGEWAAASEQEQLALAGYERTLEDGHPRLMRARNNAASTLLVLGDPEGALALYERVLASLALHGAEDGNAYRTPLLHAAQARACLGDEEGARELCERYAESLLSQLDELSRVSAREAREIASAESYLVEIFRFLMPVDDPLRFTAVETLRAVAAARRFGEGAEGSRVEELAAIRARLVAVTEEAASDEALLEEVSRLTRARDQLERSIRKEGSGVTLVDVESVAAALSAGSAAVGFRRHRPVSTDEDGSSTLFQRPARIGAHVVLPDGTLAEVDLGPTAELEPLIHAWRESLGQPLAARGEALAPTRSETPETNAGERLRERLLDPVLAVVGDARQLHVSLDDFLHALPVDALPLGPAAEDGVVRDRYVIVHELSFARLLTERPPSSADPALLVVGGVDFEDREADAPREASLHLAPLAQTRAEALAVARIFQEAEQSEPTLLEGTNATTRAFQDLAAGRTHLHVATHGWFEPGADDTDVVSQLAPMLRCGLAFAGANHGGAGILTAEELAGVDLSDCELAVLSACETNVGIRRAGQGIQSLQTALHAAGARAALTSLWKVDDAATRKLMELFYTYLWVEELPKAEALWKAKCDLRAAGHPVRDWAAWVLSGDPR